MEAVKTIVGMFGVENVFILSKCGTSMQQATVCMLGRAEFFEFTGLRKYHVLFCTDRKGGEPPKKMERLDPPENFGSFQGHT